MATLDTNTEFLRKAIKLVDELLETGDWTKGLYLETTAKKLTGFKEEAQSLLGEIKEAQQGEQKVKRKVKAETESELEVFISIYQSDPDNILMWQSTLRSITDYSVARPIYRKEDDVKQAIRSKPDPTKEGYAVVSIRTDELRQATAGKMQEDQLGNELLTVKEGAIAPEKMNRFVHGKRTYNFDDGTLTLESEAEF